MKTVVLLNEPNVIVDCWREDKDNGYLVIRRVTCRSGKQAIAMVRLDSEAQGVLKQFLDETIDIVSSRRRG